MTNGTNVANRTVLITGANRGNGRALVSEALKRGAKRVYATARVPLQIADERVTPLTLDVTSTSEIQRAVGKVDALDVRINNAGIAACDDLTNPELVERHLAVNLFGPLRVANAFAPLLKRPKGAIANNLSLAALAALPMIPAYSISKAAAFNMAQSLRALLAADGGSVHAVVLGPIDTEMSRGFEIPKASPEAASAGIRRPPPSPRAGATARSRPWTVSSQPSCRRLSPVRRDVENHPGGWHGGLRRRPGNMLT